MSETDSPLCQPRVSAARARWSREHRTVPTCWAEHRVGLMRDMSGTLRESWLQIKNSQQITAGADEGVHLETALGTEGCARLFSCLLMPTSHPRYHLQASCPRTELLPEITGSVSAVVDDYERLSYYVFRETDGFNAGLTCHRLVH